MNGFKLNDEQRHDVESIYNFLRLLAAQTANSLQRGWDKHLIDDMTQQAVIWAAKACESFDRSSGTKFISYASKWIPHKLQYFCRQVIDRRHETLVDEPMVDDRDCDGTGIMELFPILRTEAYEMVRRSFGLGQPSETHQQIAIDLGISRTLVGRRINRLLVRLHKHMCASGVEI